MSAAAYAKAGDKTNACIMATTIALAAVGAGGAAVAFKAAFLKRPNNEVTRSDLVKALVMKVFSEKEIVVRLKEKRYY